MRWLAASATTAAVGYPDCELIGSGLIAQPIAAWTSLAFLPVGVWILTDRAMDVAGRAMFGLSVLAVGAGSFLGHADATDWGRELDSLSIKLMLITFVLYPLGRRQSWTPGVVTSAWLGAFATVSVIQLLLPASANPLLAVLAGGALVLAVEAARDGTGYWLGAGLSLIAGGALLWWLGRDGGPWCSVDASLQPHGLWHILAAAGFACLYQVHRSSMP
ncbi:MAG: hypothetical protein ACR2OI_09055 [Acidimicrobiia bacterium]